jgi:hypothetical protein
MTTTTTTTIDNKIIKLTEGTLKSDVFYGSFETKIKGKNITVLVHNHIKSSKGVYEFRIASKCKAGFISIHDYKGTSLKDVIAGYKKNALVNIQIQNQYGTWVNVYTTKGNKWCSIDKAFLEVLTVGDMRESFPDMCDMELWGKMGAKTWADKAFTQN